MKKMTSELKAIISNKNRTYNLSPVVKDKSADSI